MKPYLVNADSFNFFPRPANIDMTEQFLIILRIKQLVISDILTLL